MVWRYPIRRADEGRLYFAGLRDLYSGEIVGYAMSARMTKYRAMQALFRAVLIRRPKLGPIQHIDRGSRGGFLGSAQHRMLRRVPKFLQRLRRRFPVEGFPRSGVERICHARDPPSAPPG
ncbi:hypothetical protein MB84_31380 (plasmid) [Pandoraea oxalativorans]|uniref:Integrase catalytic domain-containing protein n=1 Tax=Pandoraea oxalativorans TaxID=573737 RepID=A0A192B114_9BURK|nr:hypothetical protein MB84_31380 [Pandoraea oxalativorans]